MCNQKPQDPFHDLFWPLILLIVFWLSIVLVIAWAADAFGTEYKMENFYFRNIEAPVYLDGLLGPAFLTLPETPGRL